MSEPSESALEYIVKLLHLLIQEDPNCLEGKLGRVDSAIIDTCCGFLQNVSKLRRPLYMATKVFLPRQNCLCQTLGMDGVIVLACGVVWRGVVLFSALPCLPHINES